MDAVAVALAFVARREARTEMPAAKWAYVLSFDLGWMNPGQARAFVGRAAAAGLLVSAGEALRLSFDAARVEVPHGFRPDPEAVPARAGPVGLDRSADLFVAWLGRLVERTGRPREAVLADVASRQDAMGGLLTAEAAILWLAAEAGLDVREDAVRAADALQVSPSSRGAAPGPGPEARR